MAKTIHYGWIILLLAFLALLTVQGVRSAFGAFMVPWEHEFHATRSAVSLVAVISFIVYGISQPIIGYLIDRLGIRKVLSYSALIVGMSTLLMFFATSMWQLLILFGFFSSVGFGGASSVTASVAVTNWFHRRRGVALGAITAGMSAGQLVVVPLSLLLIERYDWRLAGLIIGAALVCIVFPLLYLLLRTHPSEKGLRPYGDTGERDSATLAAPEAERRSRLGSSVTIVKSRSFWMLAIPYMLCGYTAVGLMETHLIPLAQHQGHSMHVAGATVSILALFNIAGTLISGQLADRVDNRLFLFFLYSTRGLSLILLLSSEQWGLLIAFAVVFGLVDFATISPTMVLAGRYFPKRTIGFTFGLLSLSHQIGSALGALIPGLLYDATGGYEVAFISAIVLLIGAALLCLLLPPAAKSN
ncbi:MFS transporter [Paenibacillaceae bacterium WGS1546]|uniref:MFS transporter n=1 Tax=Cohnella sp. WGS1546 TaxID=3366810 RepID=UPI00372D4615